jgi:hypothetical protein
MQPFEVAALALPVADRVIDKFQLAQAAEIRNGENRTEDALQTGVFSLFWKQIHLKKALIGALLHLNKIRDRDGCFDLGKVYSLAERTV